MKSRIMMIFLPCIMALIFTVNVFAAEDWKTNWEETLKKARQEGQVTLIGGSSVRAIKDYTNLFKEKFGIELVTISGRAPELIQKIQEERKGGLYLHDLFLTGGEDLIVDVKPKGFLDPLEPALILPEVVDPKYWYESRLGWLDNDHYVFAFANYPNHMVVINTAMVKPGEIKSYQDLLNPKWKGKIAISDPSISGLGNVGFSNMVYYKMVSMDFLRELASQGNPVMRDLNLQAEWVAKGKYPIILWPSLARVARYTSAGAPVGLVYDIKEGTDLASSGSCASIFNKTPHPNAAKVFINWFLSKEGQSIMQKETRKQTRRLDVPSDELEIFEKKLPGQKYVENVVEMEDFLLKEWDNYKKLGGEVFGQK